jgi:hypothetical protein
VDEGGGSVTRIIKLTTLRGQDIYLPVGTFGWGSGDKRLPADDSCVFAMGGSTREWHVKQTPEQIWELVHELRRALVDAPPICGRKSPDATSPCCRMAGHSSAHRDRAGNTWRTP